MAESRKKKVTKTTRKTAKKPAKKSSARSGDAQLKELVERASKAPRKTAKRPPRDESRAFVIEACRMMKDSHCENIVAYDVTGKSDVTDYILIATGTSDRQMRSVADDLAELGRKHKLEAYGKHADGPTTWIVIDLVTAVVHLFEPQARAFYDLEMLWGDCPKVEWQR